MNIVYLLLLSFWSATTIQALTKIHVDPNTGHYVDEAGRVRMFRGINAVNKRPPYYFNLMLNQTIVKELAGLGMNIIRLGNMWNGWQPIGPDSFDNTYVDIIEKSIKTFENNGMYTLMDTHQDGLFPFSYNGTEYSYWGVPKWIKQRLVGKARPFPWPMKKYPFKIWPCRYFTDRLSTAFGLFYQNYNGTADDFARFWRYVAKRLKKYTSVIGYELLNEPGPANIYEGKDGDVKLENLLPGIVGQKFLTQFYERLHMEIRKEDDQSIIFWEPGYTIQVPWGYLVNISPEFNDVIDCMVTKFISKDMFKSLLTKTCGELQNESGKNTINAKFLKDLKKSSMLLKQNGTRSFWDINEQSSHQDISRSKKDPAILGPGLVVSPGGNVYANRSSMSWHYYCWALGVAGSNEEYDLSKKILCDHILGPMTFKTALSDARRIGGGQMLTEWGLCQPNVNNSKSQNTIECNYVLEEAEKNFVSWIYWDTSDTMHSNSTIMLKPDGTINKEAAVFFSRPYPIATAGLPIKLSFDVWKKKFRYEFHGKLNKNSQMDKKFPTEIFVPKIHYPNKKYIVKTSKDLTWRVSPQNEDILQLFIKPSLFTNEVTTTSSFITITPQQAIM